jgi:peptidoglycan/LPS O-acetylase OafA/YrhL
MSSGGSHGAAHLRSLQMLRAIAALLVVLFHTGAIFGRRAGLSVLGGAFAQGGHGVDLFFVLSGFVIAYAHRRDWSCPPRLGNYLFNRISRIYPSALILGLLALATYALAPAFGVRLGLYGAGQPDKLGGWSIVASLLLLPQQGTALVNVSWTLKHEMIFYLVFAGLIVERRFVWVLLLWQAAVLACALAGVDFAGHWARFPLGPLNLEFGLGMGCAWLAMQRKAAALPPRPALLMVGLLLGVAIFAGGAIAETYWLGRPRLPDVLIYGGGSALIVGPLALLELQGRLRSFRFLCRLGDASYAIYLVHFSTIMVVSGLLLRLRFVPPNDLTCVAVAGFAVAAGVAFHRFVDQPLQRALRRAKPRLLSPDPRLLGAGAVGS